MAHQQNQQMEMIASNPPNSVGFVTHSSLGMTLQILLFSLKARHHVAGSSYVSSTLNRHGISVESFTRGQHKSRQRTVSKDYMEVLWAQTNVLDSSGGPKLYSYIMS